MAVVALEDSVFNALRGHHTGNTKLPTPRLIKIYVASVKNDFTEERRMLLEVVGPELQSLYDDRQIEIEIIDMHFGTGSTNSIVDYDPFILDDHLSEVVTCQRVSRSIFFIALLGNNIGNFLLPTNINDDLFDVFLNKSNSEEIILLKKWYELNDLGLYTLSTDFRTMDDDEWKAECDHLRKTIENHTTEILNHSTDYNDTICDKLKHLCVKPIEREINKALELNSNNILSIFRDWENEPNINTKVRDEIQQIKSNLTSKLPSDNYTTLTVEWSENGIDPEQDTCEKYLQSFRNRMTEKLRTSIDNSLAVDPDGGKGRKKTVQEIFYEHATHLIILNEYLQADSLISSQIPDKMRAHVRLNFRSGSRHSPYFLYGPHGSGKSTLISHLYTQVATWFDHIKIHRLIRFAAATPRAAYNLELLRVICQQISIILNIPEGYLPKDASFDPLYINNWFQNLLKRCEDLNNEILFIFIDDLHKLNPLDCDIVAALSWLPISLPWNVYLVCSTTTGIDSLKLTPIQKERFRSTEFLYDLSNEDYETKLKRADVHENFTDYITNKFDEIENRFGKLGMARLATYITSAEYGLTETECLELLMPTFNSEALINTVDGDFNFSTFRSIRNHMKPLIREKLMSGKLLIEWRHTLCMEIAKKRYMDNDISCMAHKELVNIFFPQDTSEADEEENSEHHSEKSIGKQSNGESIKPINGSLDISYSNRHVEESWHHLIRAGDTQKLKEIAVCNFDFLLAAVQTVSISYLRCLIEHVRCYILDRDIELVYYTIRKSSDVLTRDPMQLGAQVISWLRAVTEHQDESSILSILVRSATAWCDGYTVPLLVPLTGWLPVPLPSQIRCMTVPGPGPIRFLDIAPSKQHLIISPKTGDTKLWHIMSNTLTHTFKGHTGPVTCMTVPKQSQYFITGSEDTSIIIWDMKTLTIKNRIWEHIAAVLCITCALNNTLIISGGDDSSIIISSFATGKSLTKINHHRGPVTAVKISAASDVLVSSSTDASVCLWSLDDYSLLNTIQLSRPIINIQISSDSIFLLAHCEDNGLYLRTLATGTELHALKGHKSKVRDICIAMDGQRAIVGCDDTRALIFDMHSGRLIRSLPPNPGPMTAVYVMDYDDYLITAGGNKITFYSFRNEDSLTNYYPKKKKPIKQMSTNRINLQANTNPVSCFDVSRDSQLAAVATHKSLQIWQLNTPELQTTLDGHTGPITCVSFSANSEFVITGSEDKSVIVWGMTLRLIANTFKNHSTAISTVIVMMDSRRIVSADRDGCLHVWLADSLTILQTVQAPYKYLAVTNNMKFAVCTNGDTSLRIWSLTREDEKYTVSHSEEITCFIITVDSLYVISGSRDMSLKVWQATGGKLAQVLVGHTDAVTCVAVSVTNKTQVISGSKDANLIVWDILTGEELHTLAGHLAPVTCVKVSADGTTAVSGSDDKTLIVWETKRGLALTSLQLHVPFTRFDISLECSRILVQLVDSSSLPVICLLNTTASYIKLPTYSAPARDVEDLRPAGAKRPARRLLKKEVSLDTYTWQKKYAHLTSSVMMAQVDERLKRRFSVSASMEEISKIAEMKTIESQQNINPEQAALAQSQHFDQLEALWNKRSPPRRRIQSSLSRQSSLAEDKINSSDEDEFLEERTGMFSGCPMRRPLSLPVPNSKREYMVAVDH